MGWVKLGLYLIGEFKIFLVFFYKGIILIIFVIVLFKEVILLRNIFMVELKVINVLIFKLGVFVWGVEIIIWIVN